MRKDFQIALLCAIASLPAGLAMSIATDYFPFLKEHPSIGFWGSLGVTFLLLALAVIIAIKGEQAAERCGAKKRMTPFVGMILSGIFFLGFAAWYLWSPMRGGVPVFSAIITSLNILGNSSSDKTDLVAFVEAQSEKDGIIPRKWTLRIQSASGKLYNMKAIAVIEPRTWRLLDGSILSLSPEASLVGSTDLVYTRGARRGRILFSGDSVNAHDIINPNTVFTLSATVEGKSLTFEPKAISEIDSRIR